MFEIIKNYIKTKPRLYDLLNSIRPIKSETERWLNNFSKENNKKVNFIQIGTSDGLRWDPVRRFIIRDKWSGILVEPLPPVFNMLKDNYSYIKNQNLIFVNAAISSKNNECFIIWSFTDKFCDSISLEDKMYFLRKSSSDRKLVEASLKHFDNTEDKMTYFSVQCLSVNTLIDNYWNNDGIDLIIDDAEGHDDEIIRNIDFEIIHPKAILFESHNLADKKKEIHGFLTRKGYMVSDLSGDSVAVCNA